MAQFTEFYIIKKVRKLTFNFQTPLFNPDYLGLGCD